MFDTLFGAEMPLAVKFFLAFLVVLGLILGFAWAVRRFRSARQRENQECFCSYWLKVCRSIMVTGS